MFTQNPYESQTDFDNTPLSHTSSMMLNQTCRENRAADLSESLPAQN